MGDLGIASCGSVSTLRIQGGGLNCLSKITK